MATILVIEDDFEIRQSMVDLLELNDYTLLSAADGEEGVRLARQHLPDIIVSDIMMPGIDGYEVLSRLKSNPLTALIPFIFLSAKADVGSARKGMGLGADDYLSKPFMPDELIGSIEARLQKHRILRTQLDSLKHSIGKAVPHEFLTPLNSILGFSEILHHQAKNEEPIPFEDLATFSGIIRDSGKRLLRLVQNYILYTKLSSNTPTNRIGGFIEGGEGVVQDTLEEVSVMHERKGEFTFEVEPCPLAISNVDLAKILFELSDNAFKFSEPNTTVSITGKKLDASTYEFRVHNKGRGLSEEQIASIGPHIQFEREVYEQQGAGLGLALVQLICGGSGGTVSFKSEPGQFFEAIVSLPTAHL